MSLKGFALGVLGLFVAIQLVPYGHAHSNPPAVLEPKWDSPETQGLAGVACFDCHSNHTRWPAYSYVAPISWLVQNDVDGGRRHLNFSEWNRPQSHAQHASEEVRAGRMPPGNYTMMHAAARLSADDCERLAKGFEKMFGPAGPD